MKTNATAAPDFERTRAFVESLKVESPRDRLPGYRFSPLCREPSLAGTCLAVLTRRLLADPFSAREQEGLRGFIGSGRDGATGLFLEPGYGPEKLLYETYHEYFTLESNYFAHAALAALGERPADLGPALSRLSRREEMERWLGRLGLSRPWKISNLVMFVGSPIQARRPDSSGFAFLMDWVRRLQDPATGLHGTNSGSSLFESMAATYHYLSFFTFAGEKIPYADRIFSSTLKLQSFDGLFASVGGGGSCADLDSIDCIVRAGLQEGLIDDAARRRVGWCARRVIESQLADGAFPDRCPVPYRYFPKAFFHGGTLKERVARYYLPLRDGGKSRVSHRSSYRPLPFDPRAGSLFSVWFRLLALKLAGDAGGLPAGHAPPGDYSVVPGLGVRPSPE